jgi:hypothetical protein
MKNARSRRRAFLAAGAGIGVAAVALASAAGLGGIIVEQIGAESSVVADPFTDGVTVSWGDPVYDAAEGRYVVSSFTVSRDAGGALPIGRMRVTVAAADGTAITEAVATTTGTSAGQEFALVTSIPVESIGSVAVVFTDLDASADYAVTAAQIGTAPGSVWVASDASDVTIDDDADLGPVLALSGTGAVEHGTQARVYADIDNVYDAQLDWMSFTTGSVAGQIDPVTSQPLDATSSASITARVEAGSSLWFDAVIAYGDTDDALSTTRVTCLLDVGTAWTTVELNDCTTIDDDMDMIWQAAESWTYEDPYFGSYTYAAGDHLNPMHGGPAIAILAGYGFHVEGGGTAWIGDMSLRGQTIGFAS